MSQPRKQAGPTPASAVWRGRHNLSLRATRLAAAGARADAVWVAED